MSLLRAFSGMIWHRHPALLQQGGKNGYGSFGDEFRAASAQVPGEVLRKMAQVGRLIETLNGCDGRPMEIANLLAWTARVHVESDESLLLSLVRGPLWVHEEPRGSAALPRAAGEDWGTVREFGGAVPNLLEMWRQWGDVSGPCFMSDARSFGGSRGVMYCSDRLVSSCFVP